MHVVIFEKRTLGFEYLIAFEMDFVCLNNY